MKLVIAEKPSVAMSIAKVIGAKKRCDGYVEGNGYIISWCVGHLVRMSSPEKYDKKYKSWNIKDLPIIPESYKYEVSKYTKKQYDVLKKLFSDKKVTEIVNACDAGREGELIFRLVYNQAKCKKTIKRLWISSMEDSSIKKGFENLKDGRSYENLYQSALARTQADWLIGMNLSRYYSVKHNRNYSVGRVQTPTLSMIVDRDNEIKNFKKQKYFTVDISAGGMILTTGRIDEEDKVRELLRSVTDEVVVLDIEKKEKIIKPDKLYDLTTLQRECNKYFSYSAKQTLDYAQSLYEKKLITYPRTDSRYLTEDMKDTISDFVDKFGLDRDEKNFNSLFNSSKVTDHHAIIPTNQSLTFDISTLQNAESKVFELIKAKLLAARAGNMITENTKVIVDVNGSKFTANGTVVSELGFTKYLTEFVKEKEDKLLPKLEKGQSLIVDKKQISEKFTKPPKNFTEDSLLKAMELAGNKDLDGVEVERKGLGTPATRAGIIENLIKKELIKRDGKKLIATDKGSELILLVQDFLKSPKTTSDWEKKLYEISEGKTDVKRFTKEIEENIKAVIFSKGV